MNSYKEMPLEEELTLRTSDGVLALMESSKSSVEWNFNCNKVKWANGGYPSFWYPTIVASGVAAMAQTKW